MRISHFILLLCSIAASCQQENSKTELAAADTSISTAADKSAIKSLKTIVFFGNSLTAGYGLSIEESFPSLIQERLDSLKLPYKTVNAGLSGETSAGGLSRIDWILKQPIDVFVLELGANDGLRGLALKDTKENLQKILGKVKAKYPDVKLVVTGMQMPPSMGKDYTLGFKKLFEELAKENQTFLVPFLLNKVAGNPSLNQGDGIHPTAAGAKIVADNVWEVLKTTL